ncbi:MAG: hypothetical protein WBM17_09575 [Anaerolineales bacterium]
MPVYLFYDKKSGEILHIHREFIADTGKTVELNPEQLLKEFKSLLPPKADAAVLTLAQEPEREHGYRYSVDTGAKRLKKVTKPWGKKEASKCQPM